MGDDGIDGDDIEAVTRRQQERLLAQAEEDNRRRSIRDLDAASSVFGDRDVWIESQENDGKRIKVLAKLDSIKAAFAAYKVYKASWPNDRIIVKHRARVIRKSWED